MKYKQMTEADLELVVQKYIAYYNTVEECCWTYEKAYKRIHQVLSMEGSMCMLQYDDQEEPVGFLMGYYKEFDDITGYFLEEIVIFLGQQDKGYGTAFLQELERVIQAAGAVHVGLSSVNDEQHKHFYSKLGYYIAGNFIEMGKFIE